MKSFRVIDLEGNPTSDIHKECDSNILNEIYKKMLMLDETDKILYMA